MKQNKLRERTVWLREGSADVASRLASIQIQLLNEIAEHKQTELALRESEERYRTLFTLGPCRGLFVRCVGRDPRLQPPSHGTVGAHT
jgi:PAS domain-containing protein